MADLEHEEKEFLVDALDFYVATACEFIPFEEDMKMQIKSKEIKDKLNIANIYNS